MLDIATKIGMHNLFTRITSNEVINNFPDYYPISYNINVPLEFDLFKQHYNKKEDNNIWIVKPFDQARGRGIKLFKNIDDILLYTNENKQFNFIVQKYIEKVHTILNKKYELRYYILVTSLSPLIVYLYEEPVILICTTDYDINNSEDIYGHVTNYAIQKEHPQFELLLPENKLTNEQYKKMISEEVYEKLKEDVKVLLSNMFLLWKIDEEKNNSNRFELLGIDIIVSDELKPKLVDISYSPSLFPTSELKQNMIDSLFDLILKIKNVDMYWKRII